MLDPKFNHKHVETGKYDKWLEKKVFFADVKSDKKPYSIVLPPPNVTGKLHLGHAWDGTLQDILIRFKKMQGFEALWIPGMDHAGIATQAKVFEKLVDMGIDPNNIGREKFLEYAWEWKEEYAQTIRNQWSTLGLALDYSKEVFTLDENVNMAVNKVFVELYNKELIYQGYRITNWDPKAQTALSDIEVIHKDIQGAEHYFKYVSVDDADDFLEIMTTRPETMFGDGALAVHPDDERYNHLEGKLYIVPNTNIQIPIILDEYVSMQKGSGVVKITMAHDPNDFEVAKRHNLEPRIIMDEDGKMAINEFVPKAFQGLDRFEARKLQIAVAQENGLLIKVEEITHSVGHSERTGVVVEPLLSKQWYVKMKPLADQIMDFQQSKEKVDFFPERFENTFLTWMENIQDWCISRQLWWGHQIPVWYHNQTGEIYVSDTPPHDLENYTQDKDVLDTWFSSALWPFVLTIWSDNEMDLSKFYPTSTLVTGYDIIFFWVARMMFQACEFTKTRPFDKVLIHGLIRGEDGRKMSKSLGNGIDPIDVIQSHGADALRFFLISNSSPGLDLRYSSEKLDASWNFINKVWNVSRYVLMNTEDVLDTNLDKFSNLFDSADNYILMQLDKTILHVSTMMDKYEFGEVARSLTNFVWDDFAAWYVEVSKISLHSDDQAIIRKTKTILKYVNITIIKMLHPFMPFVTDEIYTQIEDIDSLILAKWPSITNININNNLVDNFKTIKAIITNLRVLRAENEIKPSTPLHINLESMIDFSPQDITILKNIGRLGNLTQNQPLDEECLSIVLDGVTVEVAVSGAIDKTAKMAKVHLDYQKICGELSRSVNMLANDKFRNNAPIQKLQQEAKKAVTYIDQYEEIKHILNSMNQDVLPFKQLQELNGYLKEIDEKA